MNPQLSDHGYIHAKGLLEPQLADFIYKTILLQQWRGEVFRDNFVPSAASVCNSALTDTLLLELKPKIEVLTGCSLVETYSYARIYLHGDAVIRHRDRESCEVSVSLMLGKHGGDATLSVQPDIDVAMQSGDGLIYLGCEMIHWRERFNGNTLGQIFLHYVVADGRFKEHYFDRCPQRFPPSVTGGL